MKCLTDFSMGVILKFSLVCLYFLMCQSNFIKAQKILVVNDNDYVLYNNDTLINDLKASGKLFDIHNVEKDGGPTALKLMQYDAVIWYASTDGVLLNFWETSTISNLKNYIDSGKFLWVIGLDILFDIYGSPPKSFNVTDFEYEYLGIQKYAAQSYGNDGNTGCAEMNKTASAPSSFISTLKWVFPTLWWADAYEVTGSSQPLYKMGPSTYTLADGISMHYFQSDKKKVICTFFDPALIDSYSNRVAFLKSTLDFINIETNDTEIVQPKINIYPNPTSDFITISCANILQSSKLYNINGGVIYENKSNVNELKISLQSLNDGIYILKTIGLNGIATTSKIIKQ